MQLSVFPVFSRYFVYKSHFSMYCSVRNIVKQNIGIHQHCHILHSQLPLFFLLLYSKMNHFASNSFQTLSFLQKSVTLSLNPFTIFCILKKTYFTRRMTMAKRKAVVSIQDCVACGCCIKVCPRNAISISSGIHANINQDLCVGCGKCAKECPASVIVLEVIG